MNEQQITYRIKQLLNRGLDLDAGKLARLKAAREAALAHQSGLACRFQAGELAGVQIEPLVEKLLDPVRGLLFVHRSIPLALRAFASACDAREQWVLTLPSEQPMTAAVSATSNSSQ